MIRGKNIIIFAIAFILLLFPGFAMANEGNIIDEANAKENNIITINGKNIDKTKLPVIKSGQKVVINPNQTKIFVLEKDETDKLIIELEAFEKLMSSDGDIGVLSTYQWKDSYVNVKVNSWLGIGSGSCRLDWKFAYTGTTIPTWHTPTVTPTNAWPNYWSNTSASPAYLNSSKTKAEAIGNARYHNAVPTPYGTISYYHWDLVMKITANGNGTWDSTFWTK